MSTVLLDKNIPWGIRRHLTGHTVRTTEDEGWSDLGNGDLLSAAERAGFDVMLTADQGIRYQQNLTGRRLALIVLSGMAGRAGQHSGDRGRRRCGDTRIVSGGAAAAAGASEAAEGRRVTP